MRAVLNGRYKLHELAEEITRLTENLEANGVEEIDSINVYFTPLAFGRTMRFYNAHGDEIEIIRFKQAAPKDFVPMTGDISTESKGESNPAEAERIRRQMRGEIPVSHSLNPPRQQQRMRARLPKSNELES